MTLTLQLAHSHVRVLALNYHVPHSIKTLHNRYWTHVTPISGVARGREQGKYPRNPEKFVNNKKQPMPQLAMKIYYKKFKFSLNFCKFLLRFS